MRGWSASNVALNGAIPRWALIGTISVLFPVSAFLLGRWAIHVDSDLQAIQREHMVIMQHLTTMRSEIATLKEKHNREKP